MEDKNISEENKNKYVLENLQTVVKLSVRNLEEISEEIEKLIKSKVFQEDESDKDTFKNLRKELLKFEEKINLVKNSLSYYCESFSANIKRSKRYIPTKEESLSYMKSIEERADGIIKEIQEAGELEEKIKNLPLIQQAFKILSDNSVSGLPPNASETKLRPNY